MSRLRFWRRHDEVPAAELRRSNPFRVGVIFLVVLAIAVGLGVGLLLTAISGINAVNNQNDRYAWLDTTVTTHSATSRPGSSPCHG